MNELEQNTTTQTAEQQNGSQTTENAQSGNPATQADNNAVATENGAQGASQPAGKTFTQEELNKIVADRINSEHKRWEKKIAEEKAEAERVAKMTADEKARHEQEKRDREYSEREAALVKRERVAVAKDKLAEKNVPLAFIAAVDVSADDTIDSSVEAIAKAFSDAVSTEVQKRLASAPPKKGTSDTSDLERQITSVFRKH